MAQDDRLRIAVFIDFDNIEIGVKNTLGASFDAGLVLEALKERGEVVSKTAYSDWQRATGYSRSLTQHAIKMVQRNLTPGGDKNGADINLALDALEMAFTHQHINAFVIVGGDSDFISLVEKLKQYDKKVFIVGGRQFTSGILQRNCHEFIAYENLVSGGARRPAAAGGREVRVERSPIEQAIPLVNRALQVILEREVSPQLGLLKSTLLQLDSTFSERNYGAGSFRDFVQKLEQIGVVKAHHAKGGLLVELVDGGSTHAPAHAADTLPAVAVSSDEPAGMPMPPGEVLAAHHTDHPHGQRPQQQQRAPLTPPPAVTGTAADGLREFKRILASAQVRRWPMYLRNVKQILRQTDAAFDERAYGFGNLTDLLRAAHKDGVVRVDRDRQGVIRVFQGAGASTATPNAEPESVHDAETDADALTMAAAAAEIGVPMVQVEDGARAETPEPGNEMPDEDEDEIDGNRIGPPVVAASKRPSRARRPAATREPAARAPRAAQRPPRRTRKAS